MDWTKVKQWAQQPTTIHAFGAVAFGVLGAVAHFFGANQEISFGVGLAGYALTHAGINDSTASKPIEKMIEDAAQGYVQGRLAGVLPALIADAPAALTVIAAPSALASPQATPNPTQTPGV